MKKSSKKRICSVALAGVMLASSLAMAGCGQKADTSATQKETNTDVKETDKEKDANATDPLATDENGFTKGLTLDSEGSVNIFGFSEGKNYEKVFSKFEELTKDTLKTKLNFQWATDIKTEQPLQLASQSDIDLIFDASWVNSANNISQGMYQDLSKYFLNPDYPGFYKAFPQSIVDAMKDPIDGNIYGIPFFKEYNNLKTIMIRGDWREKLNCAPVTDEATLQAYLKAVDENKDELGAAAAMGLGNRGYYYFLDKTYDLQKNHIFEVAGTGARVTQNAYILLNNDNTKLEDVVYVGDPDSSYSAFPGGVNFLKERTLALGNTWGKYVNADAISGVTGADVKTKFQSGLYGAIEVEFGSYLEIKRALEQYDPNAKLEYYFYDSQLANKESGAIYMNQNIANNYLYMPYYNDNPDRVMAVLDWIFESQANNDLFSYGIEGEDFEKVGDNQFKDLQPANKYSFPKWLFSENPTYVRYDEELSPDMLSYFQWASDEKNFLPSPFAGFNFNTEAVTTEYTAFTTIQQNYYLQFMLGSFGADTETKLNGFYDETKDYTTVLKEEVKKQLGDYFTNKK